MYNSRTFDYLTITAPHKTQESSSLEAIYDALRFDAITNDCDEKPARALGYKGNQISTMFLGQSEHGMMLRVSGALANVVAGMIAWLPGVHHATRIDAQITWDYGNDRASEASRQAEAVRNWQAERGLPNPPTVRLLQAFGKGDTCTIGSRSSEVFIRIYDKSREMKDFTKPSLWRYEVELKGSRATEGVRVLQDAANPDIAAFTLVDHYMRRAGVSVPWSEATVWQAAAQEHPKTDVDKKLEWMRSHVRSSVQYLLAKGAKEPMLEALGLDRTEPWEYNGDEAGIAG